MAVAPPIVEIGSTLGGYRIEGLIGRGGMGAVYRATHLRLDRPAAVKVLPPQLAEDEAFRLRFIRESQLAASLEHPNVIPVYDADEDAGVLFIAMRYVEGGDLGATLAEGGTLEPIRAVGILEQVAAALDAAHDVGLIHRDVKPANILLENSSGRVYLADFGVAKRQTASHLTVAGSFLGTIDYCSPEQIQGKPVDGRADIYALGCVLFQCLAGRPPYVRETDVAVIHAHLMEPPPSLMATDANLAARFDDVVSRAMAKDREERYPNGAAFATALRSAALDPRTTRLRFARRSDAPQVTVRDAPVRALPPEPAKQRTSRRPLAFTLVALVVSLAAVLGVWLSTRGSASYDQRVASSLRAVEESSLALGKALAATSNPQHLAALRQAALAQVENVDQARGRLESLAAPAARKHDRLLDALTRQHRYAQTLGQAASDSGSRSLVELARAEAELEAALAAYRDYYAVNPAMTNRIAGSGLGRIGGVEHALYLRAAGPALASLEIAAAHVRTALAAPVSLKRLGGTSRREERAIASASTQLEPLRLEGSDRSAQARLLAATASHLRFVRRISQATTASPQRLSLAAGFFSTTRAIGESARNGYRSFFAKEPSLSGRTLRSGLGGLGPLRQALLAARNVAPTVRAVSAQAVQGKSIAINLRATDRDSRDCELAFAVVRGPAHGALGPIHASGCHTGQPNADAATITYRPKAGYAGSDSFSFRAVSRGVPSAAASVSISVAEVPASSPPPSYRAPTYAPPSTGTRSYTPSPSPPPSPPPPPAPVIVVEE